jgi:hypothetical protein
LSAWLHTFATSGVTTWVWLPPAVAFAVSFFTSMVGVSGAFLLLPFQVGVLGYASPAVSATNLVYNLVATPGGVYRYLAEGRMLWPLAWVVMAGSLPGVAIGYGLRVTWLAEAAAFSVFVGVVLLGLGLRLLWDRRRPAPPGLPARGALTNVRWSRRRVAFDQGGRTHGFGVPGMAALSVAVGIVGGIYGIGGGAIMAPVCVALFGLPVHAIAGATLLATLFTSVAGVALYAALPAPAGVATAPDLPLGLLFGVGGLAGMYAGARCQRLVSQRALQLALAAVLIAVAVLFLTMR